MDKVIPRAGLRQRALSNLEMQAHCLRALLLWTLLVACAGKTPAVTTVFSWGSQTNVPPDLTNVTAVEPRFSLFSALKRVGRGGGLGGETPGHTNPPPGLEK